MLKKMMPFGPRLVDGAGDDSAPPKSRRLMTGLVLASAGVATSVGLIATFATPVEAKATAVSVADEAKHRPPAKRPELPRQWRWERSAHSFDGMFRQR